MPWASLLPRLMSWQGNPAVMTSIPSYLFPSHDLYCYAAEKLVGGYETVAFCEQDEFCQAVLRKHWPDVPVHDDVRTFDANRYDGIDVNSWIVTGKQKAIVS